jgi:hypothetical protein
VARSMSARALCALATVLLLFGAVCGASGLTPRMVTATASQSPAGEDGAAGSSKGSGRDSDGEQLKDELLRAGSPVRRPSETSIPEAQRHGGSVRGTAALAGTTWGFRPHDRAEAGGAGGGSAPAAQRLTRLQVFRC